MRIIVFLCLFLLSFLHSVAYHLEIVAIDADKFRKLPDYRKNPADSASAIRELNRVITKLHEESFLAAGADTLLFRKDSVIAYVTIGNQYNWVALRKGNVDHYMLDRTGFREKFYRNKPFRYKEYHKLELSFIRVSENNGYPFAYIRLDSLNMSEQGGLSASLYYQKGPFFTFDSINIIGKTKTKKRFIMRHLRIAKGQPYSQTRVDESSRLLRELPYLIQLRPPEVVFSKNQAVLNLFLSDKKVNQLDGIIGFLPGESGNNKLLITGELNLGLRNMFGTGKNITLEWKKIKKSFQILDVGYFHPKLLGSSLDMKLGLNILWQDSSFQTVSGKISFIQRIGNNGAISLNGGIRTSSALSGAPKADTTRVKFADFRQYTYGLGYDWNNLNDIFYPRRGWKFSLLGYLGNKTIRRNPAYADSLYDGVQLRSVQFNLEGHIEKYFRLGKGSVLLTRVAGGQLFNQRKNIFFNDLYRIGGLKSLRGFNENNFFASSFGTATLEYRFFTDETSYLLLFYDQGYIFNILDTAAKADYPLGFGAGVSFSTPAGVFNFIYSLGQSRDQKISINLSKIHFGLTSRF